MTPCAIMASCTSSTGRLESGRVKSILPISAPICGVQGVTMMVSYSRAWSRTCSRIWLMVRSLGAISAQDLLARSHAPASGLKLSRIVVEGRCDCQCGREPELERPGMELEALGDVVTLLCDRIGVINPDRAEHGIPDQAGADRGAQRLRIGNLLRRRKRGRQPRYGRRIGRPQAADVGEQRDLELRVRRDERHRRLQFG